MEQREDYEVTLNVASHDVNLLRFLLGDRLTARAFRVRSKGIQLASLETENFDIALELGRVDTGRWEQSIEIYFRRGLLQLLLPSPLARQETAQVVIVRGGQTTTKAPPPDRRIWAFKAQAAQFLDVVRGTATPVASGCDALADLEIIEDLWAPRRSEWVKLPSWVYFFLPPHPFVCAPCGAHPSVPTHIIRAPTCRVAVKEGLSFGPRVGLVLDGREHGGRLGCVGGSCRCAYQTVRDRSSTTIR